jgi:hypothetical protein
MIDLIDAPWFVPPPKGEGGGVDYLGLRQVNLDLMAEFMPGINNVTGKLRPYSLMCWAVWRYLDAMAAESRIDVERSEFERFREKIEVLFGWSHQLVSEGVGLVGNAQVCPTADGEVPLSFATWSRNVSWLDPVFYGPSLKDESGLGFLVLHRSGLYGIHAPGVTLAVSLDACLKSQGACYEKVASIHDLSCPRDIATAIHNGWSVSSPSAEEKAAFRGVFYCPTELQGLAGERHWNARARRAAATELIQFVLADAKRPLTVNEIRRAMAVRDLVDQQALLNRDALISCQELWRVLQLRQAQRLALEALFGWSEKQIWLGEARNSESLVEVMFSAVTGAENLLSVDDWVVSLLDEYGTTANAVGCCLIPGFNGVPDHDLFIHVGELLTAIKSSDERVPSVALKILLLVVVAVEALEKSQVASRYLDVGQKARVSLIEWSRLVRAREAQGLRRFLSVLVENYLLSQHFGVAALRTEEGKPRLRLTIEEEGLVSLLPSAAHAWHPALTPDRLESALSLMSESELIARFPSGDGVLRYQSQ